MKEYYLTFQIQLKKTRLQLKSLYQVNLLNYTIKFLGAGLGRLFCDFIEYGYEVEGCEFSNYMMVGFYFLLDYCTK